MTAEIHYGDVGTIFRPTVKNRNGNAVDISSATVLTIKFQRPDNSTFSKTATLTNDGTDGIMQYTTASGDLNLVGEWKLQGYAELPTGQWHTNLHEFRVHRNLS